MRHLHFVQALDPLHGGGMGAAALELHLEFMRLGVDSSLIATRDRAEEPVSTPGVRQLVRQGPQKAFFVPRLRQSVESAVAAADVIHGHGFYVDLNRVFGKLAISHGKALVSHVHGIFDPWHLARSRRKKGTADFLFERRNREYTSLWRALTKVEEADIRSMGIQAPIVVAPNGVHLVDFKPPSGPSDREPRSLLFLGRLHPQKGIDLLLRAWAQSPVMRDHWSLTIVGPDRHGYRSELERLMQSLNLSKSVRFVGALHGRDKSDVLHCSTALIAPSRSEGFPLVVLEAMAAGLPIVATRSTNVEGIESHGAGFECEASVESLVEALSRVHSTPLGELDAMGLRAVEWVRRDFSWTSAATKILDATDVIR